MISWFSRSGSVGVASEAELRFHLKKRKKKKRGTQIVQIFGMMKSQKSFKYYIYFFHIKYLFPVTKRWQRM